MENNTIMEVNIMAIFKILARTGVLFVCSVIITIGVLIEGTGKLLDKLAEYLVTLDNKLAKMPVKKIKKTKTVPTEV